MISSSRLGVDQSLSREVKRLAVNRKSQLQVMWCKSYQRRSLFRSYLYLLTTKPIASETTNLV
ncbi:MAG: hypothetical protein KME06_12105 [Kastovskya adunca ATA6-11-RM4]|nr:hypothetical protein [Kastovskya adunca ATA6-11-RM4]